MLAARDNIEDHVKNGYFLEVYPTIYFTSKWVCVARDNIKDHMKNNCF